MMRKASLSFLSGVLATVIFHQGMYYLFWKFSLTPSLPWDLGPNPLGVPKLLSISFFGGLWGMLLYFCVQKIQSKKSFWITTALFGAIFPTAVAFLIVFPLKGINLRPDMIPGGLILNAFWGLGCGLFFKVFKLSR